MKEEAKQKKLLKINTEAGKIAFRLRAIGIEVGELEKQKEILSEESVDLGNKLNELAQQKIKLEKG